ncbi:DNA sulfur modification protein DndD [Chroococcidiopsis sp. TS-821]|uniref:DNA sulfur modification protein DndD n=1 Tax=Chroococcidiopsis sp. TS-821 TaxID=1378066 RepID=UPI000CEE4120|nr:DNA sulfur modification protein DndD [Chroococcidiopsis sp. TS-821]PPS45012.1 DNA sulfur modification protein DndD [Chroococcidiopsis sp. TS-821]
MLFTELVLQNFGPYLGRQVINLRPQENEQFCPIILFGGMNGGGKTTLMDAIRLALYGHRAQCSTRGNLSYPDFLTQSVNRYTAPGEPTAIELAFESILDNVQVEFRIKRSWTKNPRNGKDTLGILVDDWPDSALAQVWDERIEDLLPLGISNLFLFDGEQVKELAEQEVPTPMVVEAIRSLLGLELAERLATDIEILVNRRRKLVAESQALITLEDIEQKLNHQQKEYQIAKEHLATTQDKLTYAQKHQQATSDKFILEGGKIAAERSQLEIQLRYQQEAVSRHREAMTELASGILPLSLISPLLIQAHTQAQQEYRQQQAQITQNILSNQEKKLLQYIADIGLDSEVIEKIKSYFQQEKETIKQEIQLKRLWLLADRESVFQLNQILARDLVDLQSLAAKQLHNLKSQEENLAAIEKQLAVAPAPEVYEQLGEAVKFAQNELVNAKAAYELAKRRCDELATLIEKTKKELTQYSEENIDRKNDEHIITASTKVQATLKLFREKLTLRKLNQLESVITECFLYLLHKSDLIHRVVVDAETFSLSLYDRQGQLVPKHRLSAGEKQLLAIALLWGLARVSRRNLPIAIDTPLGRLDSSHRNNLVERYFPCASHQVMLFSTDTEIGKQEVEQLRSNNAIAREYLLKYDPVKRCTTIEPGYFW